MRFINYKVKNVKINANCNSLECTTYLTFLAFELTEYILKYILSLGVDIYFQLAINLSVF
jgi:hypothetical protein